MHITSPEGQGGYDEKGSEMQVHGVEQNGGGSVGIHLVKKTLYVKARVREEEGFLILKNALLLCL